MESKLITVNFKDCSRKVKMNGNSTIKQLREKLQIRDEELFLFGGSIIESHLEEEFSINELVDNNQQIFMNSTLHPSLIQIDDFFNNFSSEIHNCQQESSKFQDSQNHFISKNIDGQNGNQMKQQNEDQNRPSNFKYRLKRITFKQEYKKKEWWNSTFNNQWPFGDQNKQHLSIVLGNSQQGKDTFIGNLDFSLIEQNLVMLGDGNNSCSKRFEFIQYNNMPILNRSKGIILNTIGLGDTQLEKRDDEMIFEIFKMIMMESSKISGGINTFYFVQSLTTEPVGAIERSMILMEAALGKEIFKSSVIIATKGNNIIDERNLVSSMNHLQALAKKYNVKGGVIDFRCKFKFQGKGELENPISQIEEKEQFNELSACIQSLAFFSLKPLLNQLKKQTEVFEFCLKEQYKQVKEVYIKKTEKRRQWFTLWIAVKPYTYYDKEYETYFTKTDDVIFQEATKIVLEQNLSIMKEKLMNTDQYAKK